MQIHILTTEDCWFVPYLKVLQKLCELKGDSTKVFTNISALEEGELLFILSFYKILAKEDLVKHKHNLVIHASDLPQGKGFSPMAWQILEGKNEIPFTLFEANENYDAGDFYLKKTLSLSGTETYEEWRHLEGNFIIGMILDFLQKYPNADGFPQDGTETFYRKRTTRDDELYPDQTLAEIFDKLRISDPTNYPSWLSFRGRKFKLKLEAWD